MQNIHAVVKTTKDLKERYAPGKQSKLDESYREKNSNCGRQIKKMKLTDMLPNAINIGFVCGGGI